MDKNKDLEIIDLDVTDNIDTMDEPADESGTPEEGTPEKKRKFPFNIHVLLITLVVLCIVAVVVKFSNWGVIIDPSVFQPDKEDTGTLTDCWDNFIPLFDENNNVLPLKTSDGLNILLIGNSPFSDERNSEDSVANILAELANANVYNCSIAGSTLTMKKNMFSWDYPYDAFSLYWIANMTTGVDINDNYAVALKFLGEENIPENARETMDTLLHLDYDTLDAIVIMYDATDYLEGRPMWGEEDMVPAQQFTPCLSASLDVLLAAHPNVRIIVMSPTYAFADVKDENGDYVSSDIHIYNKEVLSLYAITSYMTCEEKGVSFVDNIYTTTNEEIAKDYLIDNVHLNAEGRKKLAQRIVTALYYYGYN